MRQLWWFGLVACRWLGCPATDDDDSAVEDDDTGDDDAGDDDTVAFSAPRGACPDLAEKVGTFEVQHESDYSTVYGQVADGVVPTTILENVGEVGDCRLMRRNNPFCDPPCEPGFTCDFDGECITYPANHSAGTVTISGLTKQVEMEPSGTNNYFDTEMTHPPFEIGSEVVLQAAGDEIAAFTLFGQGVTPIDILDDAWIVREGEPLQVAWTPADGEYATIHLRMNIDQHGNTPVELVCDLPDQGTAILDSELTDQLIAFGVTGFASGNIYRRTVDHIDVEYGCVEFAVYSHLLGNLQVEGHIPCWGPDDCPDGMECDIPTNTCI